MKKIPDGSIDAIITDPPYGTTACKWDSVIPFELMWQQLNRIIKPNGAIVLFGSEPFSSALRMSNIENYKYDWIWEKNRSTGHLNAKKQPMRNTENIILFYEKQVNYNPQKTEGIPYKKTPSTNTYTGYGKHKPVYQNNNGFRYLKTTIKIDVTQNEKHPTQKPVLLMEYLIKTYTNENETVLDFTMGSGSTGVACVNTKRNFIGIEKDDSYFKIAEERINSKNLFTN
jgi:site-specific DNA-methyltransferase (adenine-specific)